MTVREALGSIRNKVTLEIHTRSNKEGSPPDDMFETSSMIGGDHIIGRLKRCPAVDGAAILEAEACMYGYENSVVVVAEMDKVKLRNERGA